MNLGEQQTQLQEGGFSKTEIENWKKEKVIKLNNAGFNEQEILNEFGVVPDNNNNFTNYFSDVKKEIINEYETQDIVSPDDEMLYQSKIQQGDPLSLKEVAVGKEFDGDAILKRGWGKTLYLSLIHI